MISQEDMAIARRMAAKYHGPRFDRDDAYQAALLRLVERDPKDQGLRVLEMKKGIAEAFTRCAFEMVVPRSSFDRMKNENRLPDHLGSLIVDDLVFEIPMHDHEYDEVEDDVTVQNMLASLDETEARAVRYFMEGKRPGVAQRAEHKRVLAEALDKLRGNA